MPSSALPVMAWSALSIMPSSLPMATAVSLWSPVIITGRIPAARHSATAAFTSGRTGSIMPARPMKHSSCSRSSGSCRSGSASYSRSAAASTRSALSAIALFSARMALRFSSVMGSTAPPSV